MLGWLQQWLGLPSEFSGVVYDTASIGTMLASLIGGTILTRLAPDWTAAKYLFISALPLADYYTGEPPPYDGMSMLFCIALLGAWAAAAIAAAYALFVNRDVFG